MKKVAIFVFLGLFLISSCNKGKANFKLKGTVTDSTFNSGLSGASVKLYATPVGSLSSDEIASTTLDSEGNYDFEFPREKVETYYIEIRKDNYFEIYEAISFSDLSIKDDNVRDYSTTAKGWIRFNVDHSNGQSGDVMEFLRENGKTNCAECCLGGYQYFYGAVDSTFYCVNDGNGVYSGYYWVQGGGPSGPVWAVTTPFDTVDVFITY